MTHDKYNNTEKLMLKLSFIAYASLFGDDDTIRDSINQALAKITPDQELVWGPAIGHKKTDLKKRPNYALIYIVRNSRHTNEYTVVIRGTNPFSIASWLEQDLNVRHTVLWTKESPHSPATEARISAATSRSIKIHVNLQYPDNSIDGKTFFEFLHEKIMQGEKLTINFTGHSLGGLMSSTLALWFYDMMGTDEMIKYRDSTGIHVYAFAGPTAGDSKFATYSDGIFQPAPSFRSCTRYVNEADIAVNVWHKEDMKKVSGFFGEGVPISGLITGLLHCLTGMVNDLEYTQLANKKAIAGDTKILKLEDLEEIDLKTELELEEHFPLYAFYKKRHLRFGVPDDDDVKKTLIWLLMAIYQHVVPYLFNILRDKHEIDLILSEIIYPLIDDTYQGDKIRDAFKKSLLMRMEK